MSWCLTYENEKKIDFRYIIFFLQRALRALSKLAEVNLNSRKVTFSAPDWIYSFIA